MFLLLVGLVKYLIESLYVLILLCIYAVYDTNMFFVIEVSCWILTGERQTAVIRSKYVQVLLNQDMSFFDTYGNNGDIVSQVLSDVLLIQSALSEKVLSHYLFCFYFYFYMFFGLPHRVTMILVLLHFQNIHLIGH